MDNIVHQSLVIKLAKDLKNIEFSEEKAQKLILQMEDELKDVLFNSKNLDERYKGNVKAEYMDWIRKDPVYPSAVKEYIEGKVSREMIERLPYILATLLVKHIIESA